MTRFRWRRLFLVGALPALRGIESPPRLKEASRAASGPLACDRDPAALCVAQENREHQPRKLRLEAVYFIDACMLNGAACRHF